jgi:hypothetical protein
MIMFLKPIPMLTVLPRSSVPSRCQSRCTVERQGDTAFNPKTGLLGPKPLHCSRNKPLKHRPGATVEQEYGNTTWTKSRVADTNKMLFDSETGMLRPTSSKQHLCCRSRSKPLKYRPVAAVGKESGNASWTKLQAAATQKMLAHVCMAQTDVAHADAAVLCMALQAPVKFCNSMKKESTYQLIWDSGASISISFDRSDFVGPMESAGFCTKLKGIAKGLSIQGKGHILWSVLDKQGMLRHLKLPAFYVPSARVRLMSTTSTMTRVVPQHLLKLPPSHSQVPLSSLREPHVSTWREPQTRSLLGWSRMQTHWIRGRLLGPFRNLL